MNREIKSKKSANFFSSVCRIKSAHIIELPGSLVVRVFVCGAGEPSSSPGRNRKYHLLVWVSFSLGYVGLGWVSIVRQVERDI